MDNKMEAMVFFRGTIEEINNHINNFSIKKCLMTLSRNNAKYNDIAYTVCLGEIDDHYLDYEVYVLPTNRPDNYIVTEITVL